jgi:hypothetical protein
MSDDASEVWRPTFLDAHYEVSNLGRVRSVDRHVMRSDGRRPFYSGVLLAPSVNGRTGYLQFRVSSRRMVQVHKAVLTSFAGPPPHSDLECRHLNGDQVDNRLVNLKWGTHGENIRDVVVHGNHHLANREDCPRGHPLVEPNLVASEAARGHRTCKACHRARSACTYWWEKHGIVRNFAEVADLKFVEIMNGDAHGIHLRAKVAANRAATLARTGGNPFHGMPMADPDVPVRITRRPIAWCAAHMAPADDCTCEA